MRAKQKRHELDAERVRGNERGEVDRKCAE
jgi:hypothetical protein